MADEIKARIVIEADTSGADEAAAALEKLQGMAGSFGEGGIGDAISQMSDGMAKGAKNTEALTEALGNGEEALKSNEEAVSSLNDAYEEHQQAAQGVVSAHEDLQPAIEETNRGLASMNDSFVASGRSMGETLASYQAFTDQFNNGATFVPETLWNADDAAAMKESVAAVNTSFASIGPTAADADKAVAEFFGKTNDAAENTGGIFDSIFGEGSVFGGLGDAVGGIGDAVGGFMMGLNNIAMPLFAAQMIGQMASSFGSYVYNANLAAEGPNASNPASFTSQVDQLTKNAGQDTNQFAVGFGAGLNPSINAWNNENNQNGGGSDFWGGAGKFLGGAVGGTADVFQVLGGSLLAGLSFGNAGMMQTGTNWENSGMQGLVNMYDAANGIPLQYPGTPPYAGASPYQNMMLSSWRGQPGGMTPAQQNVADDWQYFQGMPQGAAPSGPIYSKYTASGPNAYMEPGGWSNLGDFLSNPIGFLTGGMYTHGGGTMGSIMFGAGTAGPGSGPTTTYAQSQGWPDIASGIGNAIQNSAIGQDFSEMFGSQGIGGAVGGIGNFFGGVGNWLQSFPGIHELLGGQPQTDTGASLGYGGGGGPAAGVGDTRGLNSLLSGVTQPDTSGSFQMPHIDMGSIASNLGSQFSSIQMPHLDLSGIGGALGGAFSGIPLPHLDLSAMAGALGGAFSGIPLPHLDLSGMSSALGGAFSGITLPPMPNIGSMIQGALGGVFSGITLPPIPDIGGMISGALGGAFSGITLPAIPNIGGMINGALGGMFSGITLPSIPDIGGMVNGALGGMFGGIQMPQIPPVGQMVNGALTGMFSGIQMPQIPPIASMINGALAGMFSGIMIPGFASGVEGFGGGLAVVGEAGPELVSLPGGSSVYPMSTGGMSPLSLGGGSGSGAPIHIHNQISIDGRQLVDIIGPDIASAIRTSMGNRGY